MQVRRLEFVEKMWDSVHTKTLILILQVLPF